MLIARASSMVTKIVDPVPTLGGVPVGVVDDDDLAAIAEAPADVALGVAPVEYADVVEDDVVEAATVPPDIEWIHGWRRRIKESSLGRDDSVAIMRAVSDGAVSDSGMLPESLRSEADRLLTELVAERVGAA